MAEQLIVAINGNPLMKLDGSRAQLEARARRLLNELVADPGVIQFFLNGDPILTEETGYVAEAIPLRPRVEEDDDDIIEVEELAAALTSDPPPADDPPPRPEESPERPLVPMDERVISLEDAARVTKELLHRTVHLHDKMLDRAANRSVKLFDAMNVQLERATERTVRQAVELQEFVGKMNATLAEERVQAFKMRSAQEEIDRRELQREYARQLALAEANKPSAATILAELAVGFAGHFAANAAANFAAMNGQTIVEEN